MAKVKDDPRASVEAGCGNNLGYAEIGGNSTAQDVIAGGGISVEKSIHEARSTEMLSSEPDASKVLPTQLTIFFGGSVTVLDGISAEKVQEILLIAAAAAKSTETKTSTTVNSVPSPALNRAHSFSSTSTVASPAAQSFPIQPISFCRSAADLPIARRHSLQRFLEKRRSRKDGTDWSTKTLTLFQTSKRQMPLSRRNIQLLSLADVQPQG